MSIFFMKVKSDSGDLADIINHELTNQLMARCAPPYNGIRYSEPCMKEGYCILSRGNQTCLAALTCPDGMLLDQACSCTRKHNICGCDLGTSLCAPNLIGRSSCINSLKESMNPHYCSEREGNPSCSIFPKLFSWYQIKDVDGLYNITTLNLNVKAIPVTRYVCRPHKAKDQGLSGDLAYCAEKMCSSSPSSICIPPSPGATYEISLMKGACKSTIISWEFKSKMLYDFKSKMELELKRDCDTCAIECIVGGVRVILDKDDYKSMKVCDSFGTCVQKNKPTMKNDIMFPKSTLVLNHIFNVEIWHADYVVKRFELACKAAPFCEMIDCYFCIENFVNPMCMSKWFIVVACVVLYLASGVLIMIYFWGTTILRGIWIIVLWILYIIYKTLKYLMKIFQFCFRTGRVRLIKIDSIIQDQEKDKLMRVQNELVPNDDIELETNVYRRDRFAQRNSILDNFSRRNNKLAMTIVIFQIITVINSCSVTETVTAGKNFCIQKEGGKVDCTLTETTEISLSPIGQQSCFLLFDAERNSIGKVIFEVLNIRMKCNKKSLYFTRSFKGGVESSRRCRSMGQCTSADSCSGVTKDSKLSDISDRVNNLLGFSWCESKPGAAGNQCFLVSSSCLFYRTYVEPTDERIYEVMECPTWEYSAYIRITEDRGGKYRSTNMVLTPGLMTKPDGRQDLSVTLKSVSKPDTPITGKKFIVDGTSAILADASPAGSLIPGSIGMLQCMNAEKAKNMKECHIPVDICSCTTSLDAANCICQNVDINGFKTKDNVLPLSMFGATMHYNKKELFMELGQLVAMQLQITLIGYKLSSFASENKCVVTNKGFGGCYSCNTGAMLIYECKTDFGEALAHVTCGNDINILLHCNQNGISGTRVIAVARAKVDEICKVKCPGGSSSFTLNGELAYIEAPLVSNISNMNAKFDSSKGMNIDWGWLADFFGGSWFRAIIIVLIIIGFILIAYLTLPLLTTIFIRCIARRRFERVKNGRIE